MGNSLQDQLRALGLAKKKPVSGGAKHGSRAKSPHPDRLDKQKGNGNREKAEEISLDRAYSIRERDEKKKADAARRRKQAEDRRRRELNQSIKAIVNQHRLNKPEAEVARHFLYKGRIRKINVTPGQLPALNRGELGVVYLSGGYHLLELEHVEAVRQLSAEHVPDLSGEHANDDEEYQVPDDLIW